MTITLLDKKTTYNLDNRADLIKDLAPVVQGKGSDLGKLGKRFGDWLRDAIDDHPFDNVDALADALIATVGFGQQRQTQGDVREDSAAACISGTVSRGGGAVPDWAAAHVTMKGKQDPDLYERTDPPKQNTNCVKADVWSASAAGIVGGAAKAKNLGKFKGICGQLRTICASHGVQSYVFAHHETPREVIDAAIASNVDSVMVLGADDQWTKVN
jgi:hypothetical protein